MDTFMIDVVEELIRLRGENTVVRYITKSDISRAYSHARALKRRRRMKVVK